MDGGTNHHPRRLPRDRTASNPPPPPPPAQIAMVASGVLRANYSCSTVYPGAIVHSTEQNKHSTVSPLAPFVCYRVQLQVTTNDDCHRPDNTQHTNNTGEESRPRNKPSDT